MECGDVTPLLFLCFSCFSSFCFAPTAMPKKQKRYYITALHKKKRNKSGVITPHSIKSAASKAQASPHRILERTGACSRSCGLQETMALIDFILKLLGLIRSEERRVGKECR